MNTNNKAEYESALQNKQLQLEAASKNSGGIAYIHYLHAVLWDEYATQIRGRDV